MSLVIAVTCLKGGVGKSTVCLNIAARLHRAGQRTLLVDTDSQATLRAWAARGADAGYDGPPVVSLDGRTLRRDLEAVSENFDAVVIDSPPRLGAEARASMLVADLVMMPITPGAADVWALQETLTVLEEARGLRPDLPAVILRNRVDRTALSESSKTALSGFSVPTLASSLGNRVVFGEATLAGQSVVDYSPGSPAATEVDELVSELIVRLGGKVDVGKKGRTGQRVRTTRKATAQPAT